MRRRGPGGPADRAHDDAVRLSALGFGAYAFAVLGEVVWYSVFLSLLVCLPGHRAPAGRRLLDAADQGADWDRVGFFIPESNMASTSGSV